jgi:quercetin dioxygenase-like cupin family protein
MGYFHRWEEFPQRGVSYLQGLPNSEGLKIRIMASERMMFTQISVTGGARIPRHHHEAEQVVFVFKGKVRVTTGDEPPRVLGPGDIWVIPSNVTHGVEYMGDCEALEAVSPLRLDNFIGYTVQHTFFDEPVLAKGAAAGRRKR